jgi:phosphatidylethanolamine-binding protein (PEBP) family uncharacterized protein
MARYKKTNRNTTKTKQTKKTKHRGSGTTLNQSNQSNQIFSITYGSMKIKHLQEFTTNTQLLQKPIVTINLNSQNLVKQPSQEYVVIMTDPDAPNGENNSGNHVYTHWIFIYSSNEIKTNNTNINTILEYAPPKPPYGKHRYQFNVYAMDQNAITDIRNIVQNPENNRSTFYTQIVKIIQDNKNSKKINSTPFIFKVLSNTKT